MMDEDEALVALLAAAGDYRPVALVRGLLAARLGVLTPAGLRELAGRAGVPASVLARVGRGRPVPTPIPKPTARLAGW